MKSQEIQFIFHFSFQKNTRTKHERHFSFPRFFCSKPCTQTCPKRVRIFLLSNPVISKGGQLLRVGECTKCIVYKWEEGPEGKLKPEGVQGKMKGERPKVLWSHVDDPLQQVTPTSDSTLTIVQCLICMHRWIPFPYVIYSRE